MCGFLKKGSLSSDVGLQRDSPRATAIGIILIYFRVEARLAHAELLLDDLSQQTYLADV